MAREVDFKVAVVGRGLLGASAARHLAESGTSVCLIGPGEPPVRGDHGGVFGSHYDSGRITRITDRNPYYAQIAAASIGRYRDIEMRSGRSFFDPVGHLVITPVADFLDDMQRQVERHAVDASLMDHRNLALQFPYLQFQSDAQGIFERTTAGCLDPREFIAAQCVLVEQADGTILDATALSLKSSGGRVVVETDSGQEITARKCLVATGAFANHLDVIPAPIDIQIQEHTVVLAQVGESAVRDLGDMPTIIYKRGDALGESVYVMPPVAYPDGNRYVKIGHSTGRIMHDPDQNLQPWFRSDGDPEIASWLLDELTSLLPGVDLGRNHSESCVVTMSATGLSVHRPVWRSTDLLAARRQRSRCQISRRTRPNRCSLPKA